MSAEAEAVVVLDEEDGLAAAEVDDVTSLLRVEVREEERENYHLNHNLVRYVLI